MMSVTPSHVEAASTLAVVASSNEPLLFLAADLKVIAASASFCRAFQIDPASVPGRRLADLGAGEWASSQVTSLARATAAGSAQIEAYQIDFVRKDHAPRCLLLNAQTRRWRRGPRLAAAGGNRRHGRTRRSPAEGRSSSREGGSPARGAAQGRQQHPDHRERADAKRPQGAIRGGPRASSGCATTGSCPSPPFSATSPSPV
jgi:PAS domain-containing protein